MPLADITKWTVSDLRGLSHSQIEGLVEAGAIPKELADEVLAEDDQKHQEQFTDAQQVQQERVQEKAKEHAEEADWLERMSPSYREAYHELMDTYDDAQRQNKAIETDAEKLRRHLRGDIETAYQFGIHLPDGTVAFFDRQRGTFVDASLQPLQGNDAKEAATEFKQLSPKEQRKNACYADACYAYADAGNVEQAAEAANTKIDQDKAKLQNSNGSVSEKELRDLKNEIGVEEKSLSGKLAEARQGVDNIDAALAEGSDTENSIPAGRDESVSKDTDSKSTTSNTSFASTLDGGSNGKTSASFNAVAPNTLPTDSPTVSAPTVRQTTAPGF